MRLFIRFIQLRALSRVSFANSAASAARSWTGASRASVTVDRHASRWRC